LSPIKSNLRFIFSIFVSQGICSTTHMTLSVFTQLETCQALHRALQLRNTGPCRVHTLFLLVKKILVYLSAVESLRLKLWNPPTTLPSYSYVSALCSESTTARKAHAADRALIGAADAEAMTSTNTSSMSIQAHNNQGNDSESSGVTVSSHVRKVFPACQPMTTMEIQSLVSGCLRYLAAATASNKAQDGVKEAQKYAAYLVTAFLCLGLAPRSQVLAQIRLGSSFVKENDTFWIKLRAEHSKNNKPVMLPVPQKLTEYFTHYLAVARGTIVRQDETKHQNYVFLKRDGEGPRSEFAEWTRYVSNAVIGRAVTVHAFRSSIVTAYYEAGASPAQMQNLARFMNHDVSTASRYYYRPQYTSNIHVAHERLEKLLIIPECDENGTTRSGGISNDAGSSSSSNEQEDSMSLI